ncbi:MAG: hypothetical protein C5B55_09075 [Blastocatellia bacterium]|nr:MAG: hypothetical protein C5B55_09075 [Blastocatellia bacterium]
MNRLLRLGVSIGALLIVAVSAAAQKSMTCREDGWYNDRLVGNCEIREQTLAPNGGVIAIDGRQNGGISVKGWDQGQILVRARVQAAALNAAEAEALAKQVRIETSGAKIFATGPEGSSDAHWDVSYEVFVPRHSDLSLEAHNGGIAISDVNGRIEFNGVNGGVVLRRVGGNVHGSTTNGGLVVELSGDRWDGETLDVKTTNGGVKMSLPANYSAHLETGTVNGSISVDFPVTVQGRLTKELAVNLGSGGPTVRVMTTNGGVHIGRAGN